MKCCIMYTDIYSNYHHDITHHVTATPPDTLPLLIQEIRKVSSPLSVLLVDDEEEIIKVCEGLFQKLFFKQVKTASNGQEALDMILSGEYHFDIVITDNVMPEVNGLQLVRKLRELKPEIAIIVLSAHNESSHLLSFISQNIDGFSTKPIEYVPFFQLVHKVTNRIFHMKEYIKNTNFLLTHNRFSFAQDILENIAHQWRQPLTTIACQLNDISFCEEKVPPTITHTLNNISQTVQELSGVIDDFRSFYHPTAHKEKFTLISLLESIALLLSSMLAEKKIELKITNASSRETKIFGSKQELYDALLNIISNSIDILTITQPENPCINCTIKTEGSFLKLLIHDNGGGIKDDMLKKVFDPYSTTKHKARNVGLGLFLAKTNITHNDGSLTAYNQDNGACFEIVLPFAKD